MGAIFLAPISVSLVSALLEPIDGIKAARRSILLLITCCGTVCYGAVARAPTAAHELVCVCCGCFCFSLPDVFVVVSCSLPLPTPVSRLSACIAGANEGVE